MALPATSSTTLPTVTEDGPIVQFHNFLYSGKVSEEAAKDENYEYRNVLPKYPAVCWEPLKLQTNLPERGLEVDSRFGWRDGLLTKRLGIQIKPMSPTLGLEISNVDLRDLKEEEKNEIALMVAEWGLVAFRNQPSFTIDDQVDLVQHYGPLYHHPSAGLISEDIPHVRVLYQGPESEPPRGALDSSTQWHLDSSYELNPPGIVSLQLLCAPSSGADTVFTNLYDVYDSLSQGYQEYIRPLWAERRPYHVDLMKTDIHQRRPVTSSVHPLVTVHPVTGWKCVWADKAYTHSIQGVPMSESNNTIGYLGDAAMTSIDAQVRLQWDDKTVALWDNRCVMHAATFNIWPQRRHAVFVSAIANKPMSVHQAENTLGKTIQSRKEALASQAN